MLVVGERAVNVFHARQGVPQQNLTVDALGIDGERLFRARLRILELAGQQEDIARLDLGDRIVRKQIRGSDVLPRRSAQVAGTGQRIGELQPRVAALRVLLNGLAIFDDRLWEFGLFDIRVRVAEVFLRARLTARRSEDGDGDGGESERRGLAD